jgi:hypothetical protein
MCVSDYGKPAPMMNKGMKTKLQITRKEEQQKIQHHEFFFALVYSSQLK